MCAGFLYNWDAVNDRECQLISFMNKIIFGFPVIVAIFS